MCISKSHWYQFCFTKKKISPWVNNKVTEKCGVEILAVYCIILSGVLVWLIVVERHMSNCSAISCREQVTFDEMDVCFVLDQHS